MPDYELTKQFIETTLKELEDYEADINFLKIEILKHKIAISGEDGKNGLKKTVSELEIKVRALEDNKTAVDSSAKWKNWLLGILGVIAGSIITTLLIRLIG